MDIKKLCLGCMEDKDDNQTCIHCGYVEDQESESVQHLPPGTILEGKYLIGKALGQGGFGITYLAYDIKLELKVAIKEYFPQGLVTRMSDQKQVTENSSQVKDLNNYGLERFLREAKTLARFVEHPNIVNVRDYYLANGTAYMVMNYLEGITFQQYLDIKGGKISFAQALKIFMPVLDALKEVHLEGIIHRDISPDNIFISKTGRVKIIDFGAARQSLQEHSKSISVIMKAGYTPLEQYQSKGRQGAWTDIYALAATIYRSITGVMPPESLDRISEDCLLPPTLYGVSIQPKQEAALLKALSLNWEHRFHSASEFFEALSLEEKHSSDYGKDIFLNTHKVEENSGRGINEPIEKPNNHSVKNDQVKKNNNTIILAGIICLLLFLGVIIIFGNSSEITSDNGASKANDTEENIASGKNHDLNTGQHVAIITGNQKIGGLFPLSGPLSIFGENSAAVARLAAKDVNEWLEIEKKDWKLQLIIEDTKTDSATGLASMKKLHDQGVLFFAGPQGSGVAQACLAFANSNQILFISPSSTSPALDIEDDWLFRFCTDDQVQGPAIAAVAEAAGVTHMIFSWQGGTWGDGLQNAVAEAINKHGIKLYQTLRFDPQKNNFSDEAALLNRYVTELLSQGVPINHIGINLISFEEAAYYLADASKYPQLAEVIWIGSDGTALSEAIIRNPISSEFASQVKFINPMNRPYPLTEKSNRERVREHIIYVLGREPDAYSYNVYDIIWTLALCIDQVGYDPLAVKEALPDITKEWSSLYSASGHILLNNAGDRAYADYDYYIVNNRGEWEIVGNYMGMARRMIWLKNVF